MANFFLKLSALLCLMWASAGHAQTIQIIGAYSYQVTQSNSISIYVEKIQNNSTTHTTGTLRLELWLTAVPYSGSQVFGHQIASLPISTSSGRLPPLQYFYGITGTAALGGLPPDGSYFATLFVAEYNLGCGSADGFCTVAYGGFQKLHPVTGVGAAPQVVEFYNSTLDNYFITANASEANSIDNGSAGPGWIRTGNSFKSGGTASVCRFYGSQSPGPNSHFYTVDASECAALKQTQAVTPNTQKRWNFESLDFASVPPVNKACMAGTIPVYRAYNNGFTRGKDSNHRITTNAGSIQEVLGRGWINEGVVMCAPL